jgi:hypothetical protein
MRMLLRQDATDGRAGAARRCGSLDLNYYALTDEGMQAVMQQPYCAHLSRPLRCSKVTCNKGCASAQRHWAHVKRYNTPKPVGAEKLAASSPSKCREKVRRPGNGVAPPSPEMPNLVDTFCGHHVLRATQEPLERVR